MSFFLSISFSFLFFSFSSLFVFSFFLFFHACPRPRPLATPLTRSNLTAGVVQEEEICSNSVGMKFAFYTTISEILTLTMFDHKSADRGRGVQLMQWCHSMANIKICTSTLYYFIFALLLTVFEILAFQICDLDNVGQGQGRQFSQFPDKHDKKDHHRNEISTLEIQPYTCTASILSAILEFVIRCVSNFYN